VSSCETALEKAELEANSLLQVYDAWRAFTVTYDIQHERKVNRVVSN